MPREDGYKNLVPMDQRSQDEARLLGGQGGIASGASRRRKRSMKDAVDHYLSLPPTDQRRWNKIAKQGLAPEDIDNQMAMVIGLTERAIKGDARAAKVIIDLLGENASRANDPVEMDDDPITKSLKEAANALAKANEDPPVAVHGKAGADL